MKIRTDMDAATAVNILVSVLLLGIGLYLRRVDGELRGLRDTLTSWREEMLKDCIRRTEYEKDSDALERYKTEYVSKHFYDLTNAVHALELGKSLK